MSRRDKTTFTKIAEMASSISSMASGGAKGSGKSDDGSLYSSNEARKSRRSSAAASSSSAKERRAGNDEIKRRGIPKDVTIGGIAGMLFSPWMGVGNANDSVKDVASDPVGFWRGELAKAPILAVVAAIVLLYGLSSACSQVATNDDADSAAVAQYEQTVDAPAVDDASAGDTAGDAGEPMEAVREGESYSAATLDYLSGMFE